MANTVLSRTLKGRQHKDLNNLAGQRFGRLAVVEYGTEEQFGRWKCLCDCGSVRFVYGSALRRGVTKSCGCLAREVSKAKARHGHSRRQNVSAEYKVWAGIIRRCENSSEVAFARYGGRGIRMCDEWQNSFEIFLRDMGYRPSAVHSIDRWPNANGNYEPGNCRWATREQQARNKRSTRYVVINGESLALVDACEKYGMRMGTVWVRLKRGWSIEKAISTPVATKHSRKASTIQPNEKGPI